MMQKTVLLAVLAASANASDSSSNLRSRELWGSSSSSGWSFWGSLFQFLDQHHVPCPPGPLHPKDSNGEPLKRGECWQEVHHHHHHAHKKSGGGGGGGGGGSSSSSYYYENGYSSYSYQYQGETVTYTFVECTEGDADCYTNALCNKDASDYADCMQTIMCDNSSDYYDKCEAWIKCEDGQSDCMQNVDLESLWNGDGYATTSSSAAPAPINYDDDTWGTDGWVGNNLNSSYATKGVNNAGGVPIWPFIVGALVAGVVGAAFVVSRRKRRVEQDEHPLDGAVKKRQRLFSGFSRKKKGALNEDFDNEDDAPQFVEISDAKNKYRSPNY